MDSVGEGEGREIWENYIETCIISYMKQVASPGSMHDTGCPRAYQGLETLNRTGRRPGSRNSKLHQSDTGV